MKKVIFYCNWGNKPNELLNKYKLMTKNNLSIWNDIKGVTNISEANYIVFIEGIPRNFNLTLLKNKNVICFPREPPAICKIKNWEQYNLKNGYTYKNFYHVVTNAQFLNKDYDFLTNLECMKKNKLVSSIVSNKQNGSGYVIRRNFLINISKYLPNICDMYGYGWNKELGSSYKGVLSCYHNRKFNNNNKTKYDALINYRYSLCLENSQVENYFSEKFTDAILCWTIPIYWGCPNISKYFPKDCYYEIDITSKDSISNLIKILNTPITQKNIDALKEARELILHKYNIWSSIENIINSI